MPIHPRDHFRPTPAPPDAPVWRDRDVHLWAASLAQPPARVAALRRLLSTEERLRADRFRAARHGQRHVVAHGLLREILGAYRRRPPGGLEFALGAHGKPALVAADDAEPLHFNLAHSGDHLLVGIARQPLGVDLEVLRPDRHFLRLAGRFFAPAELHALRSVDEAARPEAFYNAWTRKEAYLKALGTGLSVPLATFEVALVPGERARMIRVHDPEDDPARWSVFDLRPGEDLVAALALRGHGWRVQAWRLVENRAG